MTKKISIWKIKNLPNSSNISVWDFQLFKFNFFLSFLVSHQKIFVPQSKYIFVLPRQFRHQHMESRNHSKIHVDYFQFWRFAKFWGNSYDENWYKYYQRIMVKNRPNFFIKFWKAFGKTDSHLRVVLKITLGDILKLRNGAGWVGWKLLNFTITLIAKTTYVKNQFAEGEKIPPNST